MTDNPKNEKVVIYGASGHGKVIADILVKSGKQVRAFVDDNEALWGQVFYGTPVWKGIDQLREYAKKEAFSVIIAVGNNHTRWKIQQKLETMGISFGIALHPSAQVGNDVVIGEGTVVMANSVINPGARVGTHCIINTAATVDHDCIIGNFVHLSPGAHLGGTVEVGDFTWIGLGASVINNIKIEERTIVGAGAVVIRNVESHGVVVGNPAKYIRKSEKI